MRKYYLLSALIFCAVLIYFYTENRSPFEHETIWPGSSVVSEMDSKEFMELLQSYRMFYTMKSANPPKNWPPRTDISYLLDMLDSKKTCGIVKDVTSSYSPPRKETRKPCGAMAAKLLRGIKDEQFIFAPYEDDLSTEEVQELRQWAIKQLEE